MAQMMTDVRDESAVSADDYEDLLRLTGLVRVALGRLGGYVSPWLDEGLLMGQGLMSLHELAGHACPDEISDEEAVCHVVAAMRTWARASSWYHAALPCRIAPLCASLAAVGVRASDREIARELGLDETRLDERYTEAGLVFGVSPELLLPERARVTTGAGELATAISGLPIEQRRLLTLYFEEGLSFPEIASLLAISPAEAQQCYGRAATAIRARIIGTEQLPGVCR